MAEHYLGIDWGTHSSKWCYQDPRDRQIFGPIWDSTVWHQAQTLQMFPADVHHKGTNGETGLKRSVIDDPNQSFWEGPRPKLGATLAEATVFSLLGLLSDAKAKLGERNILLAGAERVVVRFSHPNWKTSDTVAGIQNYRDAAILAVSIFLQELRQTTEPALFQLELEHLRALINSHKPTLSSAKPLPEFYDYSAYQECLKGTIGRIDWELVFESCAAGFPYLLEAEPEIFEGGIETQPERQYQLDWSGRKILVVDIGAGSTDAGYMLRSVRPGTEQPVLIWFPAAPALDRAGDWLTRRIHQEWIMTGQSRKTLAEAEVYKTSGSTDWQAKQFVAEWCASISEHIGDYMTKVPDSDRLYKKPRLEIVVTGGSSAVSRVKDEIVAAVGAALVTRGISNVIAREPAMIQNKVFSVVGGRDVEIRSAQFAVASGASHPRLAELIHYDEGM